MSMAVVKFRHLIDMAIGSPEPGHVNFYALHCLLSCIAEKLNIIDETIDYSKYEALTLCSPQAKGSQHDLIKIFGSITRIVAGEDTEEHSEKNPDEDEVKVEMNESHSEAVNEPEPESQAIEEVQSTTQDLPKLRSLSDTEVSAVESPKIAVHELDERISRMEVAVERLGMQENLIDGIRIMKDQLELAMDQLLLLTVLTLSKQPETQRVQQLYSLAQSLRSIRRANSFIEGSTQLDLKGIPSIDWRSSELQLNEDVSEEDVLENHTCIPKESGDMPHRNRMDLNACVCYSPEKLLDQLLELKGDFCLLTNKVNELSARLLKQESQQTLALIEELQEQLKEIKLSTVQLKEIQDRLQMRVSTNYQDIEDIKKNVEEIMAEKVDKAELEIILADKVDYNQLQRKVSLDQMLEVQCRIDKRFCEVFRQINENDTKVANTIENLRSTLGFAAIEGILQTFREQTNKEIHALHHLLQKYIDSTDDECAAAGGRVKVLQDLACLSCDTTCVMRSMERSKVGKLPNARATDSLSPLITYELGSIRKSGIMGYYRKDEFPHAPHAWMKKQDQHINTRHAGGSHTTSTARDRVDKVLLNKP